MRHDGVSGLPRSPDGGAGAFRRPWPARPF
jgi:hypothetical protein